MAKQVYMLTYNDSYYIRENQKLAGIFTTKAEIVAALKKIKKTYDEDIGENDFNVELIMSNFEHGSGQYEVSSDYCLQIETVTLNKVDTNY